MPPNLQQAAQQSQVQLLTNQLTGQFKQIVLMMLNETLDELDKRELKPEQQSICNDLSQILGQKILSIEITAIQQKPQHKSPIILPPGVK